MAALRLLALAAALAAALPAAAQQQPAPKPAAPSENRVLLDLLGQIEGLGRQVRELRGAVEESSHRAEVFKDRLEKSDKRQGDLYNDTDGRLRRLEQMARDDAEGRKKLSSQVGELELRLRKLEAAAAAAVAAGVPATAQQFTDLEGRLKKLETASGSAASAGQLGELDARLKKLESSTGSSASQAQLGDLESRLRRLESGAIPAPVGATAGAPPGAASASAISAAAPVATAPASPPVPDAEAARRAYDAALSRQRSGDSAGAVQDFRAFLRANPRHELAPNAQYWLGEAYFRLAQYPEAVAALQKLLVTYPDTLKVPDAMLVLGNAQAQLGDNATARRTLEDLISRHPLSEAAEKARQRLARLK